MQQPCDLVGDLGHRASAEALLQPGHLLELHDAQRPGAGGAPAAFQLALCLVDQGAFGEQSGAQVAADEVDRDRRPYGLGADARHQLPAGHRFADTVVRTELEPGEHVLVGA